MLTDVGGLGLALFAIRFAQRPATPDRSYGYYRAEILAALANGVLLIGVSLFILREAYERFWNPPAVASGWMLAIAVMGLAVNLVGMWILRAGSAESLNLKGAYFEVLSDLLSSLAVILAALTISLTGWRVVDPVASAAIGLFIFPRTWRLLRNATGVLLEGTPSDIDPAALREAIAQLGGVSGVHDLHVWALTSGVNAMSVHVICDGGPSRDDVLDRVHRCVQSEFKIAHATVQLESPGWEQSETHL
jgi:cobalt-zinc-cadmium efflux system protein